MLILMQMIIISVTAWLVLLVANLIMVYFSARYRPYKWTVFEVTTSVDTHSCNHLPRRYPYERCYPTRNIEAYYLLQNPWGTVILLS